MTAPTSDRFSPRRHLPADVASFIGREREIDEIERLLANARLLTITGVGGSGKTRLALRVARNLASAYADGVEFVALAPVRDSELAPRAVAAALGEQGAPGRSLLASLATSLASRRLLLILDNCEHLIGACASLTETLLRACPNLQILVTSREPLRITGEVIWRAPALAIPDAGALPALDVFAQIESVALFRERAVARRSDFAITSENAPVLAAICRKLEGLPLAIELAAGQVGALSLEQIAAHLDDALRLLGGGSRTQPRHETLRALLDWSHALLSDEERALFQRLAVFSGGCDLDAVEAACASHDGATRIDALPTLLTLTEKSLVESRILPTGARYRLLEPVRQYAWERLTEAGEVDELRQRHAHYFAELAEAAEPHLMSGNRAAWMARLAGEQANLRAALAWSRHNPTPGAIELGLRIAGALFWYWVFRGEISEALEWVEALLSKSQRATPALRAKVVYISGELFWSAGQHAIARGRLEESEAFWRAQGDGRALAYTLQSLAMLSEQPQAETVARESLALFQRVGDAWGAAHAVLSIAIAALSAGDASARTRLEEALARWRALGDAWGMAQTLNILGDLARRQGDDALATTHYQESLTLLRHQELTGTVPSVLHNLGYLALHGGDAQRALRLFRESLALFRNQGDQRGVAECLAGLAGVYGALRIPAHAARLFGAADALSEATDASAWAANAADYARNLEAVRAQLDAQAFAAAYAAGCMTPLEQIIADALQERTMGDAQAAAQVAPELTEREREVAALVAQGLTNRQIGEALVITEGTARLHVKHILHKLGFASRAQVAVWAVTHGLTPAHPA